jgi:uncharacterized membrane protein
MDLLIALLVLVLLAVPIAAIASIVMAIGTRDRLHALERRLALLERTPGGLPATGSAPAPARQQPVAPEPPAVPAPISAPPPEVQAPRPPEPPAPSKPAQPHAPTSASPPVPPQKSFEERFGTQWVVWVGGVALALGGFFLVRLSIQQGLIGPGVRVTLGALLAIAVIAAGGWARLSDQLSGIAGLPSAHIPSILTAAGTTIAYADVYAAYALYGFLPPAAAFLLLGVVALATLAAALLHGPALAGLGLVGAYVTPVLVASNRPDYWSLYIYLAVVTAAAFVLARLRMWRWLAITAIGFAFLWTFAGTVDGHVEALAARTFHVVVGF